MVFLVSVNRVYIILKTWCHANKSFKNSKAFLFQDQFLKINLIFTTWWSYTFFSTHSRLFFWNYGFGMREILRNFDDTILQPELFVLWFRLTLAGINLTSQLLYSIHVNVDILKTRTPSFYTVWQCGLSKRLLLIHSLFQN